MANIREQIIVPYTAQEMFDLVDHVEKYEEFLPWCQNSSVLERSSEEVRATLKVGTEGIHKSFTTSNLRFPNERIEMHLVTGPFKRLKGCWSFLQKTENPKRCQVQFELEFEFSNRLLAIAFSKVFHAALSSMVEAFHNRALEIYGTRI